MINDLLQKSEEFRRRAVILRHHAEGVATESARSAILNAARTWDKLALSAERHARLKPFTECPDKADARIS
ncbi:MAG: hypothetical protein ACXWN9_13290 [Candidatus Binataceae bacterium]